MNTMKHSFFIVSKYILLASEIRHLKQANMDNSSEMEGVYEKINSHKINNKSNIKCMKPTKLKWQTSLPH